MKTLKDTHNKILKRRELTLVVEAPSNPGFKVVESISAHFKANPEMIVIKKVESGFGKSEFVVNAFIYETAEAKAIEPKPKVKKTEGGAK